jgi:predicted alpha-1,2-mannosidase
MKTTTLLIACLWVMAIHAQQKEKLFEYVNPMIGTGAHGHTYPGATLPFGLVQLSPDNGKSGWDWCSGYHYSSDTIAGFSHTHLSGTGIGDLCDISVLPIKGIAAAQPYYATFNHQQETAKPGYYQVLLQNGNINAELTTSIRTGMHRYTFQEGGKSAIQLNLGFSINWDRTSDCYLQKINDTLLVGYRYSTGWAKEQKVYFAIHLNKPLNSLTTFVNKEKRFGKEVKGNNVLAFIEYDSLTAGEQIQMKVALSFASIEAAYQTLAEIDHWIFDKQVFEAQSIWETELRKVQIKTDDEVLKEKFYTAVYHTYLAPVIYSDRFGQYKGTSGTVKQGKMMMSVHSLWDTFRAQNPWLTITQTEIVPSIINSYLAFYEEYGLLPVWDLHFNETNTMTGYHAVPVIADAILKGIEGFNYQKAYEAMKKSSNQQIRGSNFFREYGYIPQDKYGQSVTNTLEYAYDDWCIAQVARRLGYNGEYREYMKRASAWKKIFDRKTGFMRAKNSDGKWVEPFDPYYADHDTDKAAYTEGNAWQHSFFVPHDVYSLINLHRGVKKFTDKLDSLFTTSSQIKGENASPDISGLIGQYAHGNEPSHHIAYLYNYAGEPHKTADRVHQIATLYTNQPDGLCGNEDCGQMSAWYVFSVLGFYPVNPASGQYVIGSPFAKESFMLLPQGKVFQIVASNLSSTNRYIVSATLNGKAYTASFINHDDLMNGGVLVLQMGNKPGKNFGKKLEDLPGKSW